MAMHDAVTLANWISTLRLPSVSDLEDVFKEYRSERYSVSKDAFERSQLFTKNLGKVFYSSFLVTHCLVKEHLCIDFFLSPLNLLLEHAFVGYPFVHEATSLVAVAEACDQEHYCGSAASLVPALGPRHGQGEAAAATQPSQDNGYPQGDGD